MPENHIKTACGIRIPVYSCSLCVVGSGAAAWNGAHTARMEKDIPVFLVTEGVNMGTSRNTGSDKQTYYKLGLSGDTPDSVRAMAKNLFAGGSVDGDHALCEAAENASAVCPCHPL